MCSRTGREGNKAFLEAHGLGSRSSDFWSQSLPQFLCSLNSFLTFHCPHVDKEAECVDCAGALQRRTSVSEDLPAIRMWFPVRNGDHFPPFCLGSGKICHHLSSPCGHLSSCELFLQRRKKSLCLNPHTPSSSHRPFASAFSCPATHQLLQLSPCSAHTVVLQTGGDISGG